MRGNGNVLIVVPYNLCKSFHGSAIIVKHMVREFRNNNIKVSVFAYDLPWIGNGLDYYYKVKPEIVLNAVFLKAIFNFSFYDLLCATLGPVRNFRGKLLKAIEKEDSKILQVENLWALPPVINSSLGEVPIVVAVHDVYSERYQELIEYVSRTPKFLAKKIVNKVIDLEIEYLNKANVVVCLTEHDKRKYAEMGVESHKLKVIPSGVDTEKIKPEKPDVMLMKKHRIKEKDLVLFFAGSQMYQNRKAIDDIAFHIMPKILKERKNAKMLVAGTVSNYVIKKRYNEKLPIIPLGYVEDINKYYTITDIVIIPTSLGTGFKTKTLEAMAAGKPVVTNPKSTRGIKAANWENIVICEDFDDMVEAILLLDKHKNLAIKIGEKARITAEKYDWSIVMKEYIRLYKDLSVL